eukprot:469208-Prymnesium_polylepis.2
MPVSVSPTRSSSRRLRSPRKSPCRYGRPSSPLHVQAPVSMHLRSTFKRSPTPRALPVDATTKHAQKLSVSKRSPPRSTILLSCEPDTTLVPSGCRGQYLPWAPALMRLRATTAHTCKHLSCSAPPPPQPSAAQTHEQGAPTPQFNTPVI